MDNKPSLSSGSKALASRPHLDISNLPAAARELEESVHRVRRAFADQAEDMKRISVALKRWADALNHRGTAKPFGATRLFQSPSLIKGK